METGPIYVEPMRMVPPHNYGGPAESKGFVGINQLVYKSSPAKYPYNIEIVEPFPPIREDTTWRGGKGIVINTYA